MDSVRILVVDDEEELRCVASRALSADGHAVATASDLGAARDQVAEGTDLIVLDLRLPDGFGLDLCRELRAQGATLPIMLLTAWSHVALRVEGLNAGADDFLAKPFALAELRARVRALGRRGSLPRGLAYTYNDVVLDFPGRHALRAGQEVAITTKEWAILNLLAQRAGRIVSRTHVLENVWVETSESTSNILDVLIARLRRKLGSSLIRTLRGEGYSLAENTLKAK